MFHKFAFALVAVALGISPCLAENGKHPQGVQWTLGDGSVRQLNGQPKGLFDILNNLVGVALKGAQGQQPTAKSAVPGPVPLKEQMKSRMKSRIKSTTSGRSAVREQMKSRMKSRIKGGGK